MNLIVRIVGSTLKKEILKSKNKHNIKLFGVDIPDKYNYYPDWVKLVNEDKEVIDEILNETKNKFDLILIDG